ncbi:FMN-linked oxidoreductase [Ascobolus immersus RN42]|uniref:FMN-linked oxidoreductase n=1 Tax=Ascobolus immersus RN42 TaxID=1160509 RepID=A0A3N4ILC4_ASCIM|nr:FMN-linked oxidoreductase [Ascobolus immersus RN42]
MVPRAPFNTPNSCVLAPMVRSGELPTRLVSLAYGADLVWGPEVVDRAIIGTKRIWNEKIGCVDFIKPHKRQADGQSVVEGAPPDDASTDVGDLGKLIFRTKPSVEKGKVIFQLGTANPELAVEAAKIVAGDVAGIDLNSGCPKHFSVHSGMGAALLRTPDLLTEILRQLVTQVGSPFNIPISVKIRLLEDTEKTLELVRRLTQTGISHLTIHCRTTPMRPRERAIRNDLAAIAQICHDAGITCFANGDVASRTHSDELCKEYGVDGCMIATSAESNPSVFSTEGPKGWEEVADLYTKTALEVRNHSSNTKFMLARIVPGKQSIYQSLCQSKGYEALCKVLGVEWDGYEDVVVTAKGVKRKGAAAAEDSKAKEASANANGNGKKGQQQKQGKRPQALGSPGSKISPQKKRRVDGDARGSSPGRSGSPSKEVRAKSPARAALPVKEARAKSPTRRSVSPSRKVDEKKVLDLPSESAASTLTTA